MVGWGPNEAAQWDEVEGISMLPYLINAAAPIQNADWREGGGKSSELVVLGGNLADSNIIINGRRGAGRTER